VTRRIVATIAATLAVLSAAAPALADGDPASDFLLTQRVFFYGSSPKAELGQLKRTVDDAKKAGFEIRVAVITSPFDLGTLSALWERPQPYCRFLSLEIAFAYKGRLLVVNPNGFGYVDRTQQQPAKLALLHSIPPGKTPKDLLVAADAAVRRLADAAGVRLPKAEKGSSSSSTRDILIIVAAAVGVSLLSFGVHRVRQGRKSRSSTVPEEISS
jgi:hypothetical protein